MNFDIDFERVYSHPIDTVWRALTESRALAAWLMDNDFVAREGYAFNMWCGAGEGGTDRYLCEVLELEPPRRMLWSWLLDGNQDQGATFVEFRLETAGDRTRLTVRHTGHRDRDTVEKFKGGWPVKLDQLEQALSSPDLG